MMRQIKVRAWNKKTNSWIYWVVSEDCMCDLLIYEFIDKESLGQYIGQKDCEGKEIYGGDVVEASIYADEIPQILTVEYRETCFLIDYKDSESDCVPVGSFVGSIKIIGNIFENPELSEGKQ